MTESKTSKTSGFRETIRRLFGTSRNVYFISGMCYNCSAFDAIELPKGYNKVYIEWKIPTLNEDLNTYARRMAAKINRRQKIYLVGYSFGGIIVQEIAKFLNVEKIFLISTMKDIEEIPQLFHVAKSINFADRVPNRLYQSSDFMINLFNRYIYSVPTAALSQYMTVIDPTYIHWALKQITNWESGSKLENTYHIHGTRDQVFPYEKIIDPITIKGGDHLMVIKRAKEITKIISSILENKN